MGPSDVNRHIVKAHTGESLGVYQRLGVIEVAQSLFEVLYHRIVHKLGKNSLSNIKVRLRFFLKFQMAKFPPNFCKNLLQLCGFHKHVVSFAKVLYE